MKKILLFATALAALFLSASCQRENLEPVTAGATFTVTVPGETATKAFSDGTNINKVLYEIYKTDEVETAQPLAKGAVSMTNKEATVTFDLLQDQEYTVIFWAQKSANEDGTNKYYNTGDLRTVSINTATALNANDEDRAAFFKRVDFATPMTEVKKVELVRPFAQLNLGTTAASLNPVQPGQTQGYTINVEKSYVKVEGLSTTFNTLTGVAAEEDNDFEFALYETPYAQDNTEVLEVNGVKYHYVGMNYFFVSKNEDLVTVSYKIKTDKGEITNENIINVPVKANYRTNIIGNLLTTEADFEIVVDENFNIPGLMQAEGWVHTGNYTYKVTANAPQTALKEILAHADASATEASTKAAGPEVVINLEGDVYWETGAGIGSTPLLPEESLISSVVINGNGKTFTATGKGVGKIRLANGSVLTFNDLKIVDKSVSYAEDSWEYGYLEFGGAVSLNDCEVVNAIMLSGETATLTGCSFNSNHDNEYAVWVDNGSASFTGCTFTGARGLKTHEAYGSEVVEITVDGCTFGPLTKKPGMAIGTVNDKTSITIKNSFFIGCQAGDQELYIYEIDTDVTTFTFVEENNEVHANSSAMLKDWVEKAQAGDVVEVPAGEYSFPAGSIKEGVTLKCAEGTVFEGTSNLNINGATVIGATFESDGKAVSGTVDGTFKNCTFDGSEALRWCYTDEGDEILFEDCVIKTDFRGFHFDGMNGNVTFRRCKINGFNAYSGKGTATFENCVLGNDESDYNGLNIYSNTVLKDCQFVYNSGKTNFIDMEGTGKTLSIINCTATLDGTEKPVIDFVGGSQLANNTVVLDGKTYASSQTSLSTAISNGVTDILLKDGKYTMPEPDLRGKTLTLAGSKDVVIDATAVDARDQFVTGATLKFEGVTLNFGKVNYMGFANTASLTYKDCDINGLQFLSGKNVVFENCSLDSNGAEHTVWTYGVKNVNFTDCDFTYGDRGVNCYSDNDVPGGQTVNFTKCTFATENTASDGAVEINSCFISEGIVVNMDGCTAPAYGEMAYVSPWDSTNGAKTTINIK